MFKYETTTVAREHRLTLAMCLALLGVGTIRPSTWAGLVRRGLAERIAEGPGMYDFTATGQEVGEALSAEVRSQMQDEDGEDAGAHVESEAATHGPAAEVVDVLGASVIEGPGLTRADEVRSSDVLTYAGKQRRIIGTRTERGDIVLSTVHGTLTMPPGTPVRIDRSEQLAMAV